MFDNLEVNIAGGLDIALPAMHKVRQSFESHAIKDVEQAVLDQCVRPEIAATIKPGQTIAIGVGSRGVANIESAVRAIVKAVKERGADAFIFPAMGSHGGATVEGQVGVLANYGVTEERVGAPVRATMETVMVTKMADGTELHMDRFAHEADGVIVTNRIKPHTTFRGDIESGLIKMLVIGMGKITGASIMHTDHGMDTFPEVLPKAATDLMSRINFLFGVGLIEDAYDDTAFVEAVTGANLLAREKELQLMAKSHMPRLYFDDIDVLIVEQMGKEISGAGLDPNITGRNCRGVTGFDKPRVEKIVVLDLTDMTHGNATGLGVADIITKRLLDRIDLSITYANVIASAYLDGGYIPIVMPTEKDAISLAVKTTPRVKPMDSRIVRIRDTLHLSEIEVSDALLPLVAANPNLTAL